MDDKNIEELLSGEIASQIKALSELTPGSKEKAMAINDLATLYKLRIDEHKVEWDADEKYNSRIADDEAKAREEELKRRQIEEQVKDRYFKAGIAGAELIIPLIFYGIWMNKGFRFEEHGTISSQVFRNLINRFRPTKK